MTTIHPVLNKTSINYNNACLSYFILNNSIQSVKDCPADVFREAVTQALGKKQLHASCSAFMQPDRQLNMVERWYLLNSLCEVGKGLKLYRRFKDAENAVRNFKRLNDAKNAKEGEE